MTTRLASFPFARQGQVPASADTFRAPVDTVTPLEINMARNDRAYILLRNLTGGKIRYFYGTSNYAEGMTLNSNDTVRIVNREQVFVQAEDMAGEVCWDIGIG